MRKRKPKKVYTPLEKYKVWLTECSKYFQVSEEHIINGFTRKDVVGARHTFYWLCWRDNINLPNLSRLLGKHRSTIASTMNNSYQHRDRRVEDSIYEKITTKEK